MATAYLEMKVGKVGMAAPHSAYIARLDHFRSRLEKGERLLATEFGNMPKWAAHDPIRFWQSADSYERKNGTTYRELLIALPRDLSDAENVALARAFVAQEVGGRHAYQWAVHVPKAVDGGDQPHLHLMFSDRQLDGIERDPEDYFKRYNSKAPEKGGARKGFGGWEGSVTDAQNKVLLDDLRSRWEAACNRALEEAGTAVRVDMRSLEEQGVDRPAEKKQGYARWRKGGRDAVLALRAAEDERRALEERHAAQAELHAAIPDMQAALQAARSSSRTSVTSEVSYDGQAQHRSSVPVALSQASGEVGQAVSGKSPDLRGLQSRVLDGGRSQYGDRPVPAGVPADVASAGRPGARDGLHQVRTASGSTGALVPSAGGPKGLAGLPRPLRARILARQAGWDPAGPTYVQQFRDKVPAARPAEPAPPAKASQEPAGARPGPSQPPQATVLSRKPQQPPAAPVATPPTAPPGEAPRPVATTWSPHQASPAERRLMGSMVDMAVRIRANRNPKGGPIDPAIDAKYGPVLFAAWKKLGVLADQFRPWLKALLDRFGSPEATKALNEVRIWRAPFEDTRRELQDEGFLPRSASPPPQKSGRDGQEL